MPDDTGGRSAWLEALEGARERMLGSYARYAFTRGLRNEAVLTDEEKEAKRQRKARKLAEQLKAQTFTGFADDDDEKRMAKIIAEAASKAVSDALEADAKKVDPNKRPDVIVTQGPDEDRTDQRNELPDYLKSATVRAKDGDKQIDKIVKMPMAPGGLRGHSVEADRVLDEHVAGALVKAISVNKFPRNFDAGDFCVSRYCMAREMFPYEGQRAYGKYAPKESQYYQALEDYGKEFKALGEYTSGQDGGFLAPEIWTNVFFDMLYPAQVMSRLPITRMQMGGRVQHIPKLTSQVTIAYAAENAALTASQPQFAQLSFTARKQYAFIQLPNELIRDSAPAADQVIFQHAQTRMAVDRDTQMLFGNGQAGVPVGLINATNVGSYTLAADTGNGASPTYSDFVSLINLVRQLNNSTNVPVGQTDCTGVLGAVRVEQTVAALKDTNNRPLWAYGLNQIGRVPAPGWQGVPNWVLSNIVPTNVTKGSSNVTSYLIGGDWQYLVYMMRQDVEFLATNVGGTAFQNDQTWID